MSETTKQSQPSAKTVRAAMRSLPQLQAAELIGRNRSWLKDHPELGARNVDGTYNGPELVRAYVGWATGADGGDLKKRKLLAECRREEAAAMKLELQTARESGNTIRIDQVETVISTILSTYTERFTGASEYLAPQMSQEVAQRVLPVFEAYIERTLRGMSGELKRKVLGEIPREKSE